MSTLRELAGGQPHAHPHALGQSHGHPHTYPHAEPGGRRERAASIGPTASLVLDIGGEVGALVVHLAAWPPSGELEACPAGNRDRSARFHTGVHRRLLDRGVAWTAVFPEVVAGTYHLLDPADPDGAPLAQVTVDGGTVHQVDLR